MKKRILPLLLAALTLLAFIGCAAKEQPADTPDWGVTITAENVTPSGAVLRFAQNGGSPTGELNTGSCFTLQRKSGSKWEAVPYADGLDENAIGWDDVAWIIPMSGSADFETNWTWLYGELDKGEYRIGKEIMDFRGPGDYDTAMFYADFSVK